jgi:toll-like receptor 13
MNKTSFNYLVSLRVLDLSDNLLACTCDLLWFKEWITTAELNFQNYGIKKRYICASPQSIKGTALVDFQITEDDCSTHPVLHVIISLCTSLTLVCVLCSVIYRYRWYLRYYIFLARSHRRRKQDTLLGEENFKYDVYVCYHNTSRHWVINSLLPELEYRGGIKLCLHDRDWLAGPAIMDNIIDSIEHSRKTLLLVNNGFAQSVWCREETCLAYYRLIQDKRNLLVVVLLEDIQPQNMDKTLRAILSSRTYLAWKTGLKKEARFWKALRAAVRRPEHPGVGVEMGRP